MLDIEYTGQFKRDLKKVKRRHKPLHRLQAIMQQIVNEEPLDATLKDHVLIGNWKHHRELHIEPDWLLIYKLEPARHAVIFVRTGSHSDLFD